MLKNIKKRTGEIMIIIGSGLSTYNAFNFSYTKKPLLNIGLSTEPHYYYPQETLLFVTLGVVLIVAGVLIIKNKTYKK